jgi:L-fucose isomerase-like protein
MLDRRCFLGTAGALAVTSQMGLVRSASPLLAAQAGPAEHADPTPVKVLPAILGGRLWGSPQEQYGHRRKKLQPPEEMLAPFKAELKNVEFLEPSVINDQSELGKLLDAARKPDMLLIMHAELLSVTWAVRGIERLDIPVVLCRSRPNSPGAVLTDLYGYLKSQGRDVQLAIAFSDVQTKIQATRAKKRFANATALVIGSGFPSWTQVANPTEPRAVTAKLGVRVTQRSIDELMARFEKTDEQAAGRLAKEWTQNAQHVTEEAKRDIVGAARTCLAIKGMVQEANADLFTIDCRTWDELSMGRFSRFYGPCMTLSTLRFEGIPAACEADICAMLAMGALSFLSDLPAFMGNLGWVNPDQGWVRIGHASAAPNMDGTKTKMEGYTLTDYQGRGCGLASYCPVPEGWDLTMARLDKDLKNISFATGKSLASERDFRIVIGNVRDFMKRCLVGDHYAVAYGNHAEALRELAAMLDMGVLEPQT